MQKTFDIDSVFTDLPNATEGDRAIDATLRGAGSGAEMMTDALFDDPIQLKARYRRASLARDNGASVELVTKRLTRQT